MSQSKNNRVARDQQLVDGIQKHLGKSGALVLKGEKHTMSEVLAVLQKRIDASKPVAPAKAAWMEAVHKEKECLAETNDFVEAVLQYIALVHGSSMEVLADFGIFPKRRRALTSAQKAEKALKAKATREARHARPAAPPPAAAVSASSTPAPTPTE